MLLTLWTMEGPVAASAHSYAQVSCYSNEKTHEDTTTLQDTTGCTYIEVVFLTKPQLCDVCSLYTLAA